MKYTNVYSSVYYVFAADRLFPIIQHKREVCNLSTNVIKSVLNLISAIKIYFGINFLINHHKNKFYKKKIHSKILRLCENNK